jgi:hypothetical protein
MKCSVRTNYPAAWLVTLPLTTLEFKCLENICRNEMNVGNGGMVDCYRDTRCWNDLIASGPNELRDNQIPALMSNLVRKGYVITGNETCVATPVGYALYKWTQS